MADSDERHKDSTRVFKTHQYVPPALGGVAENLYALQQDLEVARKIQERLLPPCPTLPGHDFAVAYMPAGEVGGDFYDFLPMEGGRTGILVADASGKGLAGALLMVEARAMIRAMASVSASPREILAGVNRVLVRDLERGMFVSIFLAILDPWQGTFTMANAGHCPMLLWHSGAGKVETVQPRGLVLGAAAEDRFESTIVEETVKVGPGDRFILYSDGVPELMNPVNDEFGMGRLEKWLRACGDRPSDAAIKHLLEALEIHRMGQAQSDDITIVTGRLLPA